VVTVCRIAELRIEDPTKDVAQALDKMAALRRLVMTNYTWIHQVTSFAFGLLNQSLGRDLLQSLL